MSFPFALTTCDITVNVKNKKRFVKPKGEKMLLIIDIRLYVLKCIKCIIRCIKNVTIEENKYLI